MDDLMDLERTDKLFNSAIERSDSHSSVKYTEEDIKKQRVVIGFGNLHIGTAKVKLGMERMRGYRDSIRGIKQSIDRKVRNKNKYGGSKGP